MAQQKPIKTLSDAELDDLKRLKNEVRSRPFIDPSDESLPDEKSSDHYIAIIPCGDFVPASTDSSIGVYEHACIFKMEPPEGKTICETRERRLIPYTNCATDEPIREAIYNLTKADVKPIDNEPIGIHRDRSGHWICERILSEDFTTTTTPDPLTAVFEPGTSQFSSCVGSCYFTWRMAENYWEPATGNATACQPNTTTTTTPDPATTTTTTPAPCQCLPPTHCGTVDGECVYTGCVSGNLDVPSQPDCATPPTTTPDPGTTTTPAPPCPDACTTTPAPCVGDCGWGSYPRNGGWNWTKISGGCSGGFGGCTCLPPSTSPGDCVTASTPCQETIPVEPECIPSCTGGCLWYSPGVDQGWYFIENRCVSTCDIPCGCSPPSSSGGDCVYVGTPCLTNATTTTPDPCISCNTTTTTTTPDPNATTTTPDPCHGECIYTAAGLTGWALQSGDCSSNCPCNPPPDNPLDTCEVRAVPCGAEMATTTTAGPVVDCCTSYGVCAADFYTAQECVDNGGTVGCGDCTTTTAAPEELGGCCTYYGNSAFCSDTTEDDCNGIWYGAGLLCSHVPDACQSRINCCDESTGACTSKVSCTGMETEISDCVNCTTTSTTTSTTTANPTCYGNCYFDAEENGGELSWLFDYNTGSCGSGNGCVCPEPNYPPTNINEQASTQCISECGTCEWVHDGGPNGWEFEFSTCSGTCNCPPAPTHPGNYLDVWTAHCLPSS